MIDGRDALREFDTAIGATRRTLDVAIRAAEARSQSLAELQAREAKAYRALAEIRLFVAKSDPGRGRLAEIERRALSMIEDQKAFTERVRAEAAVLSAEVEALEAERAAQEQVVDAAVAAYEAQVEKTRARLSGEPAYLAERDRQAKAEAIAARAEQKQELAAADRDEKGAPYRADPLFTYLWDRKFGTADYKAGNITRMLDGWVAGLVRYRDARLNYARLVELPDRFAEHAERMLAEATRAADRLDALEAEALAADGAGPLTEAVEAARARLVEIDAALTATETRHAEKTTEAARAASGEAGPGGEARALLADALGRASIPDLRMLAAQTTTDADDRLVDSLVRIRTERMNIETGAEAAAPETRILQEQLENLEWVRRQFKDRGFDGPYVGFDNAAVILTLLNTFRAGRLGRDDLWRRVEKARRVRQPPSPDFGGRGRRSTLGLPDTLDPSPSWPRTGRPRMPRSSGGFRTGGGFRGGGGFKTGGGF